jgi:hypothetical protein
MPSRWKLGLPTTVVVCGARLSPAQSVVIQVLIDGQTRQGRYLCRTPVMIWSKGSRVDPDKCTDGWDTQLAPVCSASSTRLEYGKGLYRRTPTTELPFHYLRPTYAVSEDAKRSENPNLNNVGAPSFGCLAWLHTIHRHLFDDWQNKSNQNSINLRRLIDYMPVLCV